MTFLAPVQHTKRPQNFNTHLFVTGIFVVFSYVLSLLPLALFAIAQTLAIFGKKKAALLSIGVVCFLILSAMITGFSPLVLGALFAVVSMPIFLLVSILRQKNKSIFWSVGLLGVPIILSFSVFICAPVLNNTQYTSELQKVQNTLSQLQSKEKESLSSKNDPVYEKAIAQIESLKKDVSLQNFMSWNQKQRMVYFIYGDGFAVLLSILLSFFACLFFLDFAFEQVEKLQAIKRYVTTLSQKTFDKSFLDLLNNFKSKDSLDLSSDQREFKISKHTRLDLPEGSENTFFRVLRKPKATDTIFFGNYIFYYTGKVPGWNLRTYQMPLFIAILAIVILAGSLFYFENVENIILAVQKSGLLSTFLVVFSVLAMCALSLLVLQGVFTALKWIPFGLLVFISIVFLIISPYIVVDMGSYGFLGIFGIIGLLGYLKK